MLISSWFRTLFVRKPARLRTRLPIQQGLESLEDRKLPATFTVSNLLDNGSNGSLRWAVGQANATPGADDIVFQSGLTGTITLGGTQLGLTDTSGATTITGPGADLLTIDGNNASRIFYVGGGVSATLAGLTLTRGYAPLSNGGAILSDGDLTVLQSAIRGNSADYGGGILAVGSVTVTQSTVSGNTAHVYGGGIHANTAIVTQSTVSGNTGDIGGGIFANTAIVTQSTVSGNTAYEGGGIRANAAIVTQSTVSGNTASDVGGIYANTAIVTQSTVSGNTGDIVGGIYAYFSVTASNSLIVGNTAFYSAPDVEGSISDAGGNLIGVPNGFTLGQVVQVDGNGKPLLAYNGGPTQTIALVPGSPAINAGNDALAVDEDGLPLTTDQRGKNRFVGTVDIGAVESQGYTLSVTGGDDQTALVDAVFSNPLAVEIIANDSDDPVNGGVITFAAPGSGASATLSATSATIVDGAVSVTATANSTPGSYTVEASASGANSVLFSLTNEQRQQPTTTSVNSQTVIYGMSSVTFTGTVAGGTSTPTGNVTVTISGNGITPITGSATLSASGQFSANFTNTVLSARPSSPYTVTVTYNGDAQHLGSEGSGTLTVNKASLTGNATTQDALNMAKQGKLTITVSNVAGLQNGDTLSQFLSTADFYITVGTNRYEFIPTTVTTSGSNITITYSMKNSALASSLAAELADNTSAATAAIAGFAIESDNYTLSDSYLTRLFSTIK